MTSLRQIESNRLNALKSTGPKTDSGKQRSSANAVRHGLTPETVIQSARGRRRLPGLRAGGDVELLIPKPQSNVSWFFVWRACYGV